MTKEIEQVGRLLESNQTGACLTYIESLEKAHPDCACLTAAKLSVYRTENRWQESLPIAEKFYAREPENPVAASEYALALIVNGNPQLAISILVDAFEQSKADTIHSALLHATLQSATYLLISGVTVPAIGLGHVLKEIPSIADAANLFLYRATSESRIPLMFRDWAFDFNCPDSFPGKETFEEVTVLVRLMCWKQALALLESLIPHADAWSGIWHNIAIVNVWLLNVEKGREALKTFAASPSTPMEDAVDAETIRLLLTDDSLGDMSEVLTVEYTLSDADQVLEKLLSNPYFRRNQVLQGSISPPPRGLFFLLDRPQTAEEFERDPHNSAYHQATAFLFGKETDKEARLVLQTLPIFEQELAETRLRESLGDLVQIPGNIIKRTPASRTFILMEYRLLMTSDSFKGREDVNKIIEQYYSSAFPDTWTNSPLGVLDDKTPAEAAKEPKYSLLLRAILKRMLYWGDYPALDITKPLRSRLGLPDEETIVPGESSNDDPLSVLDAYPVWRWHRIDVSKLSTETLSGGLQIILGMQAIPAASLFAQELLNRPMDTMPFDARVMAFEAMIAAAETHADIDLALLWVERAKNESKELNIPEAAWYLHEISLQLLKGDGEAAQNAIQFLITHYGNDEDIMYSLQQLLIRIGMLNPDGSLSPAVAKLMQSGGQQAESPQIWTPDGGTAATPTAPSKLWVPD